MERIPLTQNQFALVDDADFERVNRHTWYARWDRSTKSFYAVRTVGRAGVLMARFIMGAKSVEIVDHRNHNTLDNRRQNLRFCTPSQSGANRRKPSNNTSGFVGIHWNVKDKRWRAKIKHQGKTFFLGNFKEKLDAKKAYDAKAKSLFGEFVNGRGRITSRMAIGGPKIEPFRTSIGNHPPIVRGSFLFHPTRKNL